MAGRVLGGRYTVQDKVGTGGMAIVYRGLDEVLGRTVAIKTMLPQYASDESFAARFKQEAQAAAALQSPYIVSVYDWGRDGDTYYIVMEYLRGTDLKSGIRRHGALDPQKVAQIGSQIAQALSVAHKHDIIHRDIKPQNIMVQPDGNIKVMDFGIARAKNSHLTQDNSVLGTAHYVSPEQTQGKPLGPTTDIYSLGIVMYEAATGQVPFDGDDAITVALKQVNEQPLPPSQLNPRVDPALEGIILRCMQKDPNARFQTADELYRVLRDYLAGRMQAVNAATSVAPAPVVTNISNIEPRTSTAMMPSVERGDTTSGRRTKPVSATERAQMEERRAARRRRNKVIFGFLIGAIAIAGLVYALMTILGTGNSTREVPNLFNLTKDDAIATIEGSDGWFTLGTTTEEYSDSVAEGIVADQDPDPQRKVSRGTAISLVISMGPEPAKTVTVPDIKGMEPSAAESALRRVGLTGAAGESVFSSDVEVNKVVHQSPSSGSTAKQGDVVTYQLSKGTEVVEVPSVVGTDYTSAVEALREKGFEIEEEWASSSTYDSGYIMEQDPTGEASKGSTVRIVVSAGPEKIEVPYVIGLDEATATYSLQQKGFQVSVAYEENAAIASGYVSNQSNADTASSGSVITITVSTGAPVTNTDTSSTSGGTTGGGTTGGGTTGGGTTGGGTTGGGTTGGGTTNGGTTDLTTLTTN